MKNRTDITDLNFIPNVGPATIRYLSMLGIKGQKMGSGRKIGSRKIGSSLCLTLDDKREELTIDFVLSKESFEA